MNILYLTLLLTLLLHANGYLIVYIDSEGILHDVNDVSKINKINDLAAWAQYDNKINTTG